MRNSKTEGSAIAQNRFAVAIVIAAGLSLLAFGALRRYGLIDLLVPAGGPTAESIPLYLLFAFLALGVVAWSVLRVLAILE